MARAGGARVAGQPRVPPQQPGHVGHGHDGRRGRGRGRAGAEDEDEAGSRSRMVLSRPPRKDLPPPPSMGTTSMMEEVANTGPAIDNMVR